MKNINLDIKMEHENHDVFIEEKDVSKIYTLFPLFFANVSSNLSLNDATLFFRTYDQIASSLAQSKHYISNFYAPNPFTKTIKIIVPQNSLRHLDVHLENGNIFLKNIKLQRADIFCLRGNIRIDNSSVDTLSIKGYKSDISLKNVEGTKCSAITRTGNLSLEGSAPKQTTLITTLGNIKVFSDDYGLNYTLVDIVSKKVKVSQLPPAKETQKILYCKAPYGTVFSNVF